MPHSKEVRPFASLTLRILLGVCFSLLAISLARASAPKGLGEGLAYLRLHSLPADLPGTEGTTVSREALVVDIRGATSDAQGGALLSAWLTFRCTNQAATFVLLNEETAPALTKIVTQAQRPGCVSLAPQASKLSADIDVDVTIEDDKKALERIEAGDKLEDLVSLRIEKTRYDEADLSRDYESVGFAGARESRRETTKAAKAEENKPTPPAPRDLLLARAVHIHRALLALKPQDGTQRN